MVAKKVAKIPPKIPAVLSLRDLHHKALTDKRYVELAKDAASNLGGVNMNTLDKAMDYLKQECSEQYQQTGIDSEETILEEINFCR